MRLIHYSHKHLTEVYSASQGKGRAKHRGDKPNGLWVSPEGEDDWPSWCESEEWGLGHITHPTEVVLRPDASMLVVAGEAALREFHAEYHARHPMFEDGFPSYANRLVINWKSVAKRFQGIIIAPYVHRCRLDLDMMWYYGWDCASGVIWDAGAVKELRPLPVRPRSVPSEVDRQDVSPRVA